MGPEGPMLLQLNPVLPVRVVGGPGWAGPTGPAMCVGWYKPHADHNLIWLCVMDATGQVWEVENPYVRARANITWGRPHPEKGPPP